MKRKHLYHPFEMHISENEAWQEMALVYHFFEIVQILEGNGERIVNENSFPYKKGDIYLFTPMDCRGFNSTTPTKFCSIRFSEVFLTKETDKNIQKETLHWLKKLEQIFSHHNRFQSVIIQNAEDCRMISNLISNIITERNQNVLFSEQNIRYSITLILNILSRNIVTNVSAIVNKTEEPLINKILTYIKNNIENPEKLKVKHLSNTFNISQNYLGEYFKKLTGENLQRYITVYKIKCVEQRLLYSDSTISQIADELGFTDDSHLSRQFKKNTGLSPSQFRHQNKP